MNDLTPVTREELFLAKLGGQDVNTPSPVTREELYLDILCGNSANVPAPFAREEIYLASLCGKNVQIPEPVTRKETFLAALCGEGILPPNPVTREEFFLEDWLDNNGEFLTVTGAIATFTTLRAAPLRSLAVTMGPKQDLNGYDSPWPAGGGKNLFNGTFLQGYWAYADGTWVNSPNWITTEKIPCKASTSYTVSADAKATRWQGFVWYDSNGDFISTDNLNSNVNIGLTKTSPSNAAYLIFNIAGYPSANDRIAPSDVTYFQLEEGSSSTAYAPYSNICPISGWTGANVHVADGENPHVVDNVYPVSWQSEAGTVYGGTVDLVSGLLTINRTTVNTTWGSGINATNLGHVTRKRFNLADPSKKYYTDAENDLKSNVIGRYDTLYSGDYVHMYLASTTHIWAYMPSDTAADTVMQFSYTLETPVTYQLTPTEVRALVGINNVWSDADSVTVTYRSD